MASPVTFLRETKEELDKVTWPKQQDVVRLTILVVAISLLVGIYIGGLDFLFTNVVSMIIK